MKKGLKMGVYDWIGFAGVAFGMFAALLWFIASIIKVPDQIDPFFHALRRMSRMNSRAALCACIAACVPTRRGYMPMKLN
jgi:hypothetical protein